MISLTKPDGKLISVNVNNIFIMEDNITITDNKNKVLDGLYTRVVSNSGAAIFVNESVEQINRIIDTLK